jgi:chromatin segregation and condensation protein Rec8/ScpA/Scc1 (kleisin family)
METILKLEETDFFVSSKVLLAASLLLRIKSEILLNKYIKSIDEILFGNKEENSPKRSLERIELEEEIPDLIPRSPMPRYKKVTLKELMESLNKAITTENRRIKKEVIKRNALRETSISLPNTKTISIKDKINKIINKLTTHFEDPKNQKITYTEFAGAEKEKRIEHFSPLLHLENQRKVWLHQKEPFDEIHIWMRENFIKHNGDPFQDLIDEMKEGIISEEKMGKINEALKKSKN